MSRDLLKELYRHNLCSVYLLPLLGINMFDFGPDNFVNCFVEPGGEYLHVEVADYTVTETPYHSPYYHGMLEVDGRKFIHYRLPGEWKHTFEMYREGKYSSFTKAAKAVIIQYSGLNWRAPSDKPNVLLSDARLLAMFRKESLARTLAEDLNISPELFGGELVAPPKSHEFLSLLTG